MPQKYYAYITDANGGAIWTWLWAVSRSAARRKVKYDLPHVAGVGILTVAEYEGSTRTLALRTWGLRVLEIKAQAMESGYRQGLS